ncbi:tyrosine recombinase XerS [Lactococcus petauri]|uniref:tyrosine recombinase XerS n=1 Tax=Lactococcus petauri TaxID=1940789 RepID=UPI003854ABDB
MNETKKYELKIEKLLQEMPHYVYDYYYSKKAIPYSFVTLYDYCLEYRRFFKWILNSKLTAAENIKSVSLDELEYLRKKEVEQFSIDLRDQIISKYIGQCRKYTVNRSLAALKSLFKYLSEESEDENGETYIDRNVMRYVTINKEQSTLAYRASRLNGKLFLGTDTIDFLNFVNEEYQNKISNREKTFFLRNKNRDLAILSLFLSSGIRISELINLNMDNVNLDTQVIHVIRKGNKVDAIPFAKFSLPYIMKYLEERSDGQTDSVSRPLFITNYGKNTTRISAANINILVAKYSQAFKVRVTPHMLRHTLATRLYGATHSQVTVSHQLGHSTTQATVLYTHIVDEDLKNALDNL